MTKENQTTKFKFSQNYKQRKLILLAITLLSILSIILISILIVEFYQRITQELDWLKENKISKDIKNQLTPKQIEYFIYKNSPSFQLKDVFTVFSSLIIATQALLLILITVAQVLLWKNKYNGDKFFKTMYLLSTLAFAFTFILISVQPTEPKIIITIKASNADVFIDKTILMDKMSYAIAWISMFGAFSSLILAIIAKRKLGYLTKDIYLNTSYVSTESDKNQIDHILNNITKKYQKVQTKSRV
ncbi:hypothetical protein GE118_00210 [Mycoplasma sp. NEAQ87857]|uniref:hypothetical protein n=1 Tax=Mycoplasma sp. NEAQ87857 TaxID=2683967 RepID=UPI0013183BC1|nr:hypothetical protein [Mycoplasma sp. NEAQ87857]QGZ97226.1 hypothetical protein GE118_00210 [Mycoplasma sp. NEAQ87857]